MKAIDGDVEAETFTDQIIWERDTAIEQLMQLGYVLGEKVGPAIEIKTPYPIGTKFRNKADNDIKTLTGYMVNNGNEYLLFDMEKVRVGNVDDNYEIVEE